MEVMERVQKYWEEATEEAFKAAKPDLVGMLVDQVPSGNWLVPCEVVDERVVPIAFRPYEGILVVDGAQNTVATVLPVWSDCGDDKLLLQACQRYADYLVRHCKGVPPEFHLCRLDGEITLPQDGKYFLNGVFPTQMEEVQRAANVWDHAMKGVVRRNCQHEFGLEGEDLERAVRAYCGANRR